VNGRVDWVLAQKLHIDNWLEHIANQKNETHLKFSKLMKESNIDTALKNKAEKTNIPLRTLRAVYNRGLAAWRTGHRPGVSQHQWAMGRVNSFIVGGPARKVDKDLWDKKGIENG
jgi:hypothetical protein